MKYYIIAGEASGDLHGANLMKNLYKEDPTAEIRFWGGDLMQNVGGNMVKHYRELAFMGFLEVILNLKTILNNIKIWFLSILFCIFLFFNKLFIDSFIGYSLSLFLLLLSLIN